MSLRPRPRSGLVRHPLYMEHLSGCPHVESSRRLEVIYDMLEQADMASKFVGIAPREASHTELAWVHTEAHIRRIAATEGKPHIALDSDTHTTPASYRAAKLAAGGLFSLLDAIRDERVGNGFALVRPPGHHAEADQVMGFCLFNNVALGACYAMRTYGDSRVLIVDWDLHHGNATQHSFYDDPRVLYFSTHQFPYYPGSGSLREIGRGEGEGFTVNVPLGPGHGDGDFYRIFKGLLCPIAKAFAPELILVSAGFDTFAGDPLGGMRVTPKGYAGLTRILMDLAEDCCGGRLALTLEGGYHLTGLKESVKAVLLELARESVLTSKDIELMDRAPTPEIVERVAKVQRAYWPV